MSSSASKRQPLNGVIRHGQKVVGGICLPDEEPEFVDEFIEQFNQCYGPLRMKVLEQPQPQETSRPSSIPNDSRYQFSTWYNAWRNEDATT